MLCEVSGAQDKLVLDALHLCKLHHRVHIPQGYETTFSPGCDPEPTNSGGPTASTYRAQAFRLAEPPDCCASRGLGF
jgi:hypothetical protein